MKKNSGNLRRILAFTIAIIFVSAFLPQGFAAAAADDGILGTQLATAEKMAEYSLSKNPSPKISCTMLELAEMFLEEGAIEGVRGDIAFAQACKETGYFAYGGTALPEWNNYSGLGVTGVTYNPATSTEIQFTTGVTVIKDSSGNSVGVKFSEPRLGVRAQIQHLKGYATAAPLKQAAVDPRYSLISKGIAPNWVDLNGRWAVPGVNYGQEILAIYGLMNQFVTVLNNLSAGKPFTSSVFTNLALVTDGKMNTDSFAEDYPAGGGLQYIQLDLGAYYDLSNFKLWHYFGDGRKYKDVIAQVSNDPTFQKDVTTVYNNDSNNSAGLGIGADSEYAETSAGLNVQFNTVNARYIRFYSNGSNMNSSNHYVEVKVYGLKGAVVHPASISLSKTKMKLVEGSAAALAAEVLPLNTTDKSVTWTSDDTSIATVSADGTVTGVKAGTATITASTKDGNLKAVCSVTVAKVPVNLTAGKLYTSSVFTDLSRVTDGSKSTGSFAEDYPKGGGLQYVQVDLEAYYDLSDIKLWHYYGDGRKYHDIIVQVSNDPTFATDVTTVYNNDTDNSAKLGTGTNIEYAETSAGLDVQFDTVNARYVRLYSNGSNMNNSNHYVEAEVYGINGAVVHPSSVSLNKTKDALAVGGTSALTAKVMPLNTTDSSVEWSSSDTSVATVSSSGVVTGMKTGTATITAATADGSLMASCDFTVTVVPSNLSAGKLFESSVFTGLSSITDGSKSTGSFAEDYPNGGGLQYVQVDLGAYYDLSDIKLWHYYGDGRKYKDVVVQVSNDPTFATDVTTVYNNDTNNSAGLGIGTFAEYSETSAGLDIPFDVANARYARFYSNGSNMNSSNHYVEIEIYGAKGAVVHPATVSLSKTTDTLSVGATDTLTASVMPLNTTDKGVAWKSSDESAATVSSAGVVTGVKAGTATITATTIDGSIEAACTVKVTEAPATSNLTTGKLFASSVFKDLSRITDGNKSTGSFSEDYPNGGGLQYVQVDLAGSYDISDIKLWHYFGDGRKYKDVVVQVSNDPTFTTGVKTVYNNDTDNSAKLGTGTSSEYAETSSGLDITADAVNGRYVRFYSNGSNINTSNHYVEIEIYGSKSTTVSNQAAGKTITSSVYFAGLSKVVDGNKAISNYVDCYPVSGLQWVQVDLGISYDISDIKLWHYYGDSRKYHDVVVQVSDDPAFKTGVKTVYNNDFDGSAGLGTGTGAEYPETSAGIDMPFAAVNGRYVRFYSNGSTANSYNHYVEIEVYGYSNSVIHAASISLNKTSDILTVGDTDNLTSVIAPDNAANQGVQWSSSDGSVATVYSTGKVTAVSAGTATITATTVDGSKTANCTITVNNKKGYVYNTEFDIDLNVRSAPGIGDNIQGHLYNYEKIEILGTILNSSGQWYKIIYNNSSAYVSSAYIQPYNSPPNNVVSIAQNITEQFEVGASGQIAGNSDGQGLSLGYLQWCIGQGTLQPLLNRMDRQYNSEMQSLFKTNYSAIHSMILDTPENQLKWAQSINDPANNITDPLHSQFVSLCDNQHFKDIETDAEVYYVKQAMIICDKYKLKTVRGYALAFDIAVQNGSINPDSEAAKSIDAALNQNPSMTEKSLLGVIAKAVATDSSGNVSADVLSRKTAIVNGEGIVHGSVVDLDASYGLSDNIWR